MLINPFHLNTEDLVGKIDDILTIQSSQQKAVVYAYYLYLITNYFETCFATFLKNNSITTFNVSFSFFLIVDFCVQKYYKSFFTTKTDCYWINAFKILFGARNNKYALENVGY